MAEGQAKHTVKGTMYLLGAAAPVAVLWGWYLLEHYTSWRITHIGETAQEEPIPIWLALIGTPVCLIAALVLWKRATGIAENGIEVEAEVVSVGATIQYQRTVKVKYVVDGVEYIRKASVTMVISDKLKAGDKLALIVDKSNPKRMLVKEQM